MCSDVESVLESLESEGGMEIEVENMEVDENSSTNISGESVPFELSSGVEGDLEDFGECGVGIDGAEYPNFYLENFECVSDDEGNINDTEEVIVNYFSSVVV